MTDKTGAMRELVTLQYATYEDDGFGNQIETWHDVGPLPARIRYLKGSEEVLAGRLTGVQPIEIRVRNAGDAAGVSTVWRAVNARTSETFNIRSVVRSPRGEWADLLVEAGVAT